MPIRCNNPVEVSNGLEAKEFENGSFLLGCDAGKYADGEKSISGETFARRPPDSRRNKTKSR